ncbi:hypothetical protein KXQ82_03375 [Mucilaginibacter sp. HMF5004]|uniref:LiaF transmembrane domain-containing protein n=1 Tax=Mucilaginibacter rivuli TaxID=2857527 RepID=UPI001C5E2201|nr:DUF5668 domain-containing protein [Mucilaginibacter rivuli]MBW4888735.1 hypothetical protein [Mucilaginibacter rivuli]
MENYTEHTPRNNRRTTLGIILLAVGGIYLLNQLVGFILPFWLFSWPMWLIVIGLAIGAKHNFRHPAAIILMVVGGLSLINVIAGYHLIVFWPLVLIAIGIRMVFFKDGHWQRHRWEHRNQWHNTDYRDSL